MLFTTHKDEPEYTRKYTLPRLKGKISNNVLIKRNVLLFIIMILIILRSEFGDTAFVSNFYVFPSIPDVNFQWKTMKIAFYCVIVCININESPIYRISICIHTFSQSLNFTLLLFG